MLEPNYKSEDPRKLNQHVENILRGLMGVTVSCYPISRELWFLIYLPVPDYYKNMCRHHYFTFYYLISCVINKKYIKQIIFLKKLLKFIICNRTCRWKEWENESYNKYVSKFFFFGLVCVNRVFYSTFSREGAVVKNVEYEITIDTVQFRKNIFLYWFWS